MSVPWLTTYQDDGYAVVRGLLRQDEVDAICEEITRVVDMHPDVPEELIQMEPRVLSGERAAASLELGVRKLFRPARHVAFFRTLASHPALVEIAHAILGPDILLLQSMTLMKPPNVSTEKVWHQDNAYFRIEPAQLFGFWIACDPTDVANGCMHVLPGSHHDGIAPHRGEGDLYGAASPQDTQAIVAIPLEPGDALVFHGELLHHTPANQTQTRRRAVQYHYASGSAARRCDVNDFDYEPEVVVAGENRLRRIGEP